MTAIDLTGKCALVMGVANKRSIAWAVARDLHAAGAELGFTYQGERLKNNVERLTKEIGAPPLWECDVTDDAHIERLFGQVEKKWGQLDILIHSIAFAPREELEGEFLKTSREGFKTALEVSAYSLVPLARRAAPLMKDGGSILTLTFQASERVFPGYNVMAMAKSALENIVRYLAYELGEKNIRVNAVSAGPLSTLAARGVSGFTDMLDDHSKRAPLRRNITHEEVAHGMLFLASPLASGITGQVLLVDAGYSIMGV